MGDSSFIEHSLHLFPKIVEQPSCRREVVGPAFILFCSMPVVVRGALAAIASSTPFHAMGVVKFQPWRPAILGTKYKGVADAMRTLQRYVGQPRGELDDHTRGHLEVGAVQGQQERKLGFDDDLT
jgi:hypothetical protein